MSDAASKIEEIFNSNTNGQHKQCVRQLEEFIEEYTIGNFIDCARDLEEYSDEEILSVLRRLK